MAAGQGQPGNAGAGSAGAAAGAISTAGAGAKRLRLHIATPERDFYDGDVESVTLVSTDGELGVLAGHMPTVVALNAAPVRFKEGGSWREAALTGGFAEIENDGVTILSDTAEWPEEIELNRAVEARRRAEERIQARNNEVEYMRSMVALQRALTRIAVSQHKK